ncbi:MAG: T9SS type B sorting domain-containing protein, partial [Flavobacteriaceae bacterium]|nr:T9SS type B sorting domain-containing protein [Flavobacteriaceae bacterium]
VVLTASANIIPNVQYHIKLIIADQTDENYDSAVFIQGNSFNPTVELGQDITTCADSYTLDGDIENPLASYSWYRNGSLLNGENASSLDITDSGDYSVEIIIPLGTEDCVLTDEVTITLNSEQTAEPLTNIELCDDISGDGIETFDLSVMDSEAEAAVPPGNYTISYHYSNADAQAGLNPITGTIQNTINPQTIYVRIEDLDSGCLAFTTFQLIVNPLPVINSPGNVQLCDDNTADGSIAIELTNFDANITGGNGNLTVSYHFNQTDADNGDNAIPSPYVNSLPTETLFARIVDNSTGCISTTSFTIEIIEAPEVDEQSIPALNACTSVGVGFGQFDLTEVIPDILAGLSDVTITFHESQVDAENDVNAIADETNYENTTAELQVIYIRIESNSTGCYTIVPLELHANLLYTGISQLEYFECDDESGDGIAEFDLLAVAENIANDIEDLNIDFYETQDDMTNQVNAIDQSVPFVVSVSPHTIYAHIYLDTCEREAEVTLTVNPPVVLSDVDPVDYCDTDSDGFTAIDLASLDLYITQGLADLSVSYFLTQDDATNNTNPLPQSYTNTANPTLLYARAQHDITFCFDTVAFEVNVIPAPEVTQPDDLIICDDDQDGFYLVNLNDFIPNIVSDTTDLSITFHNSDSEAQSAANPILNQDIYNADTQTVYVRVESVITTCFVIVEQNIIVNTLPAFVPISNFQNCETDGNQIAEFIFNEKDEEILNGQAGKDVLYFASEADAINRTNIIDKDLEYTNLSSPQTIYVRVENISDIDCYGISSFDLEVGSIPIFTPPTNYIVCDDISNDGIETFDLSEKIPEITSGTPETLTLSFHLTFDDADNAINALTDLNYTNIENPQQIYVRVENGTYCHAIAEFGLNVVQVPTVNLPSGIEECDVDYDGSTTFDLTVSEFEILDVRDDDIQIHYFETVDDLENNINEIQDPDSYENISNPQTVYVQVINVVSGCYAILPLDLSVNLPPEINDIPTVETCENTDSTFDLNVATNVLLDDTVGVMVTYYLSQTDAENESNPLAAIYNYSSNLDTIFVRAENSTTGCYRIQSFDLMVNPIPVANTPPDLIACDDDFDFQLEFDLSQQDGLILGGQIPANFNVTYHELEIEALTGENEVDANSYLAYDGQQIFVRVENVQTGCFETTSFGITIQRKPEVDIEDQVICLDNLPLVVSAETGFDTDTYSWTTGDSDSEIIIEAIGTYSVTVTSIDGCSTTSEFSVIESEQATIEVTETIDFSDPNNVTITVSGIGDYLYILDDGEPQESNVFEFVSLGYHTVTVIDRNGCASVTVEVLVIDAPKFMTPNNDGYFDSWHIVGVETLPGTTITIFDRYGKQLAYLTSTSEGWDGRYNGQMMPANDYWFVADVVQGQQRFQLKGHFALRR